MSKSTINQVVQRAIGDAAFRRQLQRDPQSALTGFELSADERAAITSGDPSRLTALGVDQRMSKAFGLGGLSEMSKAVIGDNSDPGSSAFIDEGPGAAGTATISTPDGGMEGGAVLVGDDAPLSAAFADPDGASSSVIAGTDASADVSFRIAETANGELLDAGFVGDPGTTATPDVQTEGTQVDDLNQGY